MHTLIEGHSPLYRDESSQAVINNDKTGAQIARAASLKRKQDDIWKEDVSNRLIELEATVNKLNKLLES